MASGVDIGGGAVQGAAAGFAVGSVPGAIIGGIVGAIGGIFKSKSKKKQRQARAEENKMTTREQAMQRRELIRQTRMARAMSIAAGAAEEGGLESSAPLGAAASITSQASGNLRYFDDQTASQNRVISLVGKAEKYASISGTIMGGMEAIASSGFTFGKKT